MINEIHNLISTSSNCSSVFIYPVEIKLSISEEEEEEEEMTGLLDRYAARKPKTG